MNPHNLLSIKRLFQFNKNPESSFYNLNFTNIFSSANDQANRFNESQTKSETSNFSF